jgi:hypothetical protein
MIGNNLKSQSSGVDGSGPGAFFKGSTLDGTAGDDSLSPLGTLRWYANKLWRRVKDAHVTLGNRTDDWAEGLGILSVTVLYSQFTDGGGASGTYALTDQIPVGAKVIGSKLVNVTGFTGNTSAVITVGDGSDVDRYGTGTPSVFTTATAIDLGAISGTAIHATAATVTITVTGGSDFTAISAGQLTLQIYYLN